MPFIEAGEEVAGQIGFVACDVGGFIGVGAEVGEVYFVSVEEKFVAVALYCAGVAFGSLCPEEVAVR